MSRLVAAILLLLPISSLSGEIYKNTDFGFKINFPDQYEIEESSDDVSETVSATCTLNGMIFIFNAIRFDKEFTDDERTEQEAGSTINIADALGSKWKLSKITSWSLGEETGYICPIKGKRKGTDGTIKFFGNFFVIIVGSTQFQMTILAPHRKAFDGNLERGFCNSLELL